MRDPIPAFRKDLNIIARVHRGRTRFLIETPATGGVLELGEEEYFLCRQMDGSASAAEIARRYLGRFEVELPARQIEALVRQLAHHDLLEVEGRTLRKRTFPEWLDPEHFLVVYRLRWRGADRALGRLARLCAPLFSRVAVLLGAAAIVWSIHIVFEGWDALLSTIAAHWGYSFFLGVILPGSLLVRSARSLAHGLKWKRGGGHVPEAGIALLYYVLPSFYCNWWGDIVWVRQRSKRFGFILSGLYFQVVLWAIGTIGWRLTDTATRLNDLWLGLSLSAAVTFVLLSANPLVMMEGYALLLNWLKVPRLRERALAVFGAWLHLQPPPEPLRLRKRLLFGLYGGLTFAYAVAMVVVHLWLAWIWLTDALEGAGALLTIAIALYMLQRPILETLRKQRAVRWLFSRGAGPLQWGVRLSLLAGIAALGFVPIQYEIGGPLQMVPTRHAVIRSDLEGLVEEVYVREGEWVEAGQPLAQLHNREQRKNLDAARAQLDQLNAERRLLEAGSKPSRIKRAEAEVSTAVARVAYSQPRAERLAELYAEQLIARNEYETVLRGRDLDVQSMEEAKARLSWIKSGPRPEVVAAVDAQIEGMRAIVESNEAEIHRTTLVSPIEGRVVTPCTEELVGTYLKPGERDLVLEIEDSRTMRAEVLVPEADIPYVEMGSPVRAHIWSHHGEVFEGRVVGIAPVVTTEAAADRRPAGALSAAGPVSLSESVDRGVRVMMEIANPDGLLKSDMTGYAKIATGSRPLWDVVLRPIIRWCDVEVWYWIP